MSSSSQIAESWISAFCSLVGHEYFAEVSEDFIEDDFNLTGLQSQVPMYKEALEMILDVEPEDASDEDEEDEEEPSDVSDASMRDSHGGAAAYRRTERRHVRMASDLSVIESSAEMLYGLIHQRFITSRPGIQQMLEKYEMGHFGTCPRVHCRGAKVLPVGCSDIPGQETVKLFCPACLDVYAPPNSRFQSVDGAFFGTTFGCLFFMTFPELDVGGSKVLENGNGVSPGRGTSDTSLATASTVTNNASPLDSSKTAPSSSARTSLSPTQSTQFQPLPTQPTTINGIAASNLAPGLGKDSIYEPRIYGFRVSEFAKTGPRMKWFRLRPSDITELDEVAIWERAQRPRTGEVDVGTDGAGEDPGDIEGDPEEDMEVLDEEEEGEEDEDEEEQDEEEGEQEGAQMPEQEHAGQDSGRRKKGRRKEGLVNGNGRDSGGAAV